jgi:hypothetical protein
MPRRRRSSIPSYYQYEIDTTEVAEVWRRGSVVGSWLLDLTAQALHESPTLEEFGGRVSDSGEGRWTSIAAIEEGVPAPVLTTALYSRFASRGLDDFANRCCPRCGSSSAATTRRRSAGRRAAHETPFEPKAPAVLAVDVGGSHVKILLNGPHRAEALRLGKRLTAEQMVTARARVAQGLEYEVVTAASRPPCSRAACSTSPRTWEGAGWGSTSQSAFGKPTKVINDAAMQALGSYGGGRMLFLGLGTGLGSTMIVDGIIGADGARSPPVPEGDVRGLRRGRGHARLGDKRWRKAVLETIDVLVAALEPEYVVARRRERRPGRRAPRRTADWVRTRTRSLGGFRLWIDA